MNPEKRLGQLEEVMAEMLQKQDRLETLAVQTFDYAVQIDTKVDANHEKINGRIDALDAKLDAKTDMLARGIANLTVENQKFRQEVNTRFDGIDSKIDNLNDKFDGLMDYLKAKLG
jgi:tetrahydromethanopterin S-methyltransferase subunit G